MAVNSLFKNVAHVRLSVLILSLERRLIILRRLKILAWYTAALMVLAAPSLVAAQAGGAPDMDTEQLDESLADPNLVNPQNKQGYGKDVPTHLVGNQKGNKPKKEIPTQPPLSEQTVEAALQLGVLVAVSLLVGVLFFLNIGIEMFCDKMCDMWTERFRRSKRVVDIEDQDPAALVGSFKRYK